MNNIKNTKSQRLRQFVEYLGFSQTEFALLSGIDRALVNRMWNDKQDVSKKTIEKLTKWQPSVNIEWLMNGQGEMLKSGIIEEKTSDENEPLEAFTLFFSSNLPVLMQAFEMSSDNLASLIKISPAILTNLIEGSRQPWLSLLLRLRKALGVSIDAMLLWDLREPETMERLKNNLLESQQTQAEMQKTMEAILRKITELEEDNKEIKKRIGMEGEEDK